MLIFATKRYENLGDVGVIYLLLCNKFSVKISFHINASRLSLKSTAVCVCMHLLSTFQRHCLASVFLTHKYQKFPLVCQINGPVISFSHSRTL